MPFAETRLFGIDIPFAALEREHSSNTDSEKLVLSQRSTSTTIRIEQGRLGPRSFIVVATLQPLDDPSTRRH